VNGLDLVELAVVDVDVDDCGIPAKMLHPAGGAVAEARAHRDQAIAVQHRHVGVAGRMHAQHAQAQAVAGGDRAQPHQGHGRGNPGLLRQLHRQSGCAGLDYAPTQAEHGLAAGIDPVGRGLDGLQVQGRQGFGFAGNRPRLKSDGLGLDILGHVN